jgi:hypothetical protein
MFDEALGTGKTANNARAERVNEFWRRGGGGGREPFVNNPDAPPGLPGFAANPNVAPMSSLYQPPRAMNALTDLGGLGLAGADMAYATHNLGASKDELKAATDAVNNEPTEANIQRLNTAHNNVAWFDFVNNFGRGAGAIYAGKTLMKHRDQPQPNMSAAGTERLDLEDILRNPTQPRTRKAAQPAAQPAAPAITAADQASRESRKFTDQGESLSDILNKAAGSMRQTLGRDPRFMPPDL